MARITYDFKGLMAPVFTTFNDDPEKSVNYDNIDAYAKFLKEKNVHGVLVNGTSGEGTCLNVAERKKTAEEWQKACKKYKISHMLQIGGAAMVDVIELAKHAANINVDAILCLPELYFKPKTELDLVNYFRIISKYCPKIPLLYYDIPAVTGITLNTPKFLDLAEKNIPNFVGLKFTNSNLKIGYACLKPGRSVFLGSDTVFCAAISLGFDSSIMTTLNICPELAIEIMEYMKQNKLEAARKSQVTLTRRVNDILKNGDWVGDMKFEFNTVHSKLHTGPTRKPAFGLTQLL